MAEELCEPFGLIRISNTVTSNKRSVNRTKAYYNYLKVKDERQQQNQVTVCSWNIASDLGNDLIKSLLIDTLDTILPDIIMLQEPIWKKVKKVKEHMQEAEGERYSTVAHEYEHYDSPSGCCRLNGKLEVGILYDPKVIQPSFSHELISQRWAEHMADLTKEMAGNSAAVDTMPMRTIAFGAMATHYQPLQSSGSFFDSWGQIKENNISQMENSLPYRNNFICISVHMFKNKVEHYLTREVVEKLIEKAHHLAEEFNRVVIIGADWNIGVVIIQKILDYRRECYDHFRFYHSKECSKLDSIVYIYPSHFHTPVNTIDNCTPTYPTTYPFNWDHQLSKYSEEERKRIGNHEPIIKTFIIAKMFNII